MKVIHCADIHLDSSLNTNLSSTKATIRNNEILQSFERLTIYAKENDVDFRLTILFYFFDESDFVFLCTW